MSCIIMLVFLFSCCVILLNILIAQLSDTYQNIQQDAQRGLEVTRAWIIARVELNTMWFGKVFHNRSKHIYCELTHVDFFARLQFDKSCSFTEFHVNFLYSIFALKCHTAQSYSNIIKDEYDRMDV